MAQFAYPMELDTLENDLLAYPITAKNSNMEGMNIMPLVVGWRDVGNDTMAAALCVVCDLACDLACDITGLLLLNFLRVCSYANLSTQLIEGPFYMWMEKTLASAGAPNYLTSPGGWMQATWAGWGGLRLGASGNTSCGTAGCP
jgi:hypothetical protein